MPNNPSAYFYSKGIHDIIGNYKEDEYYAMDYDFLLKAYKHSQNIYIDNVLGNFRFYEGAKTFDNSKDNCFNLHNILFLCDLCG